MPSFVMPSEIGFDERHWYKKDLIQIASIIEKKINQSPLKIERLER